MESADKNRLTGRYAGTAADGSDAGTAADGSDAGTIEGAFTPDSGGGSFNFEGHWFAKSAGQRCAASRNGTHYWGTATLIFNRSRNEFQGYWDYCDAGGAPEGAWHGTLIGRDPATATP